MWDLAAPTHPLCTVSGQGVRELKVCQGALLLTLQPDAARPGELPLRVLSLADGACVKELSLAVEGSSSSSADGSSGSSADGGSGSGSSLELVELFGRHLLTKEVGGPLRIRDITVDAVRCERLVLGVAAFSTRWV